MENQVFGCQEWILLYYKGWFQRPPREVSRGGLRFRETIFGFLVRLRPHAKGCWTGAGFMQFVSAQEKVELERKREDLYKQQLDVQDRIRKAAALGDLSENAEYHFAKEENRSIQRQLAELEMKLKNVSVVDSDSVPKDVVFIGHTVRLLDLDDDSETMVKLMGEATPNSAGSDVMSVSANSPMGEALMKARVGDTVRVRAPRGTMEFKILEIMQ
jgi:transcription elongation factor GreA